MRNLIILLIFPVLVFSQSSNDGARLFSLLYIKGYPTKNRKNISFEDKYQGIVLLGNDTIKSEFSLKNSYLIEGKSKIDLYDKNLKYFELTNQNNQVLKVKRINYDNKLKRILIDTLSFVVYDTNLDFDIRRVAKSNLMFSYKEKYYKLKNGLFRSFKKKIEKTIHEIDFEKEDENLRNYLFNYFSTIE